MEKMNRRKFIGATVAGTMGMTTMLYGSLENKTGGPKLKVGLIGCGGYGMADVRAAFKVGGVRFAILIVST